jgi:NADH-quinone oxidoreductase subunit H
MILYILNIITKIITIILPLLLAVAYLTLAERKILSAIQVRKGPNIVGFYGVLQPLADGLKLLLKETILPNRANIIIFIIAPIITFTLSLVGWAVIPFNDGVVFADLNIGILYIFAVSSLGVYGIITSGWSSNSKYAFLGSLRSTAQMISYEVSIGLIIVSVLLCSGSLNLTQIVLSQKSIWYMIPLFPLFIIFFVSILAETNRPPFDLPEAEGELVAGYNVEYSSMTFALFFLGEYANIILMSSLCVVLFVGGWLSPIPFIPNIIAFAIKVLFFMFLFIVVRAAYPRYRYDQLMRLGWKIFLPISLAWVIFVAGILISFDILF